MTIFELTKIVMNISDTIIHLHTRTAVYGKLVNQTPRFVYMFMKYQIENEWVFKLYYICVQCKYSYSLSVFPFAIVS